LQGLGLSPIFCQLRLALGELVLQPLHGALHSSTLLLGLLSSRLQVLLSSLRLMTQMLIRRTLFIDRSLELFQLLLGEGQFALH
jgi:hypothetical protein